MNGDDLWETKRFESFVQGPYTEYEGKIADGLYQVYIPYVMSERNLFRSRDQFAIDMEEDSHSSFICPKSSKD